MAYPPLSSLLVTEYFSDAFYNENQWQALENKMNFNSRNDKKIANMRNHPYRLMVVAIYSFASEITGATW